MALLVRPNLLPLAVVAALFVFLVDRRKVLPFGAVALPFALTVLWLNAGLYGGPFRSGDGVQAVDADRSVQVVAKLVPADLDSEYAALVQRTMTRRAGE